MTDLFSRRNVIIGGAVAAGTGAAGLGWAATADVKPAVLAFFRRALPGVPVDEASARISIDDFVSEWSLGKKLALSAAWNTAGVDRLAVIHGRFMPPARHMLTHFLINSNFFLVEDPMAQPIVYTARPRGAACGNPFANLDPPE